MPIKRFLSGSDVIGFISAIGTLRLQTMTVSPLLTFAKKLEKCVLHSTLALINNLVAIFAIIKTFADTEAERFYATGKTRRLPPGIQKRAAMRLNQLDTATALDDLRMPPSNHPEALKGDR